MGGVNPNYLPFLVLRRGDVAEPTNLRVHSVPGQPSALGLSIPVIPLGEGETVRIRLIFPNLENVEGWRTHDLHEAVKEYRVVEANRPVNVVISALQGTFADDHARAEIIIHDLATRGLLSARAMEDLR